MQGKERWPFPHHGHGPGTGLEPRQVPPLHRSGQRPAVGIEQCVCRVGQKLLRHVHSALLGGAQGFACGGAAHEGRQQIRRLHGKGQVMQIGAGAAGEGRHLLQLLQAGLG